MTSETASGKRSWRLIVAAGVAGALMGLGAIYVIGLPAGNTGDQQACAGALATAGRLKPFTHGEVAAFLPTSRPRSVAHLSFKDGAGKDLTLADFAGRTVLLNLWATWCAPCREEMPALDRLQATLGGDEFEVVAVNVDTRDAERPRKFLGEIGVKDLAFYADDSMGIFNEMRTLGRATGLPTTMLVDAKGCEIGSMYGPAEWDSDDALALLRAAVGS